MSEIQKNPFEGLLDAFRGVVRQEIESAVAELKRPKPARLLYSAKEAAEMFAVPESWLAAAARKGELPSVRVGHYVRFRIADLERWIAERGEKKDTP